MGVHLIHCASAESSKEAAEVYKLEINQKDRRTHSKEAGVKKKLKYIHPKYVQEMLELPEGSGSMLRFRGKDERYGRDPAGLTAGYLIALHGSVSTGCHPVSITSCTSILSATPEVTVQTLFC